MPGFQIVIFTNEHSFRRLGTADWYEQHPKRKAEEMAEKSNFIWKVKFLQLEAGKSTNVENI